MKDSQLYFFAFILLLECAVITTVESNGLTVNITVNGTPPPGFTPGSPTEYRAASGPYTFTCTATGAGMGGYMYVWTSTSSGSGSAFETSPTKSTKVIMRMGLHSGDGGTHTCTATKGGQSGSANITVTIVGVGIIAVAGFGQTGTQPKSKPNNSLVISNNQESGPYFRFFCRSNSLTMGVGELIGLDESPVTANSFFGFQTTTTGGELRVESFVVTHTPLTANEQGVYTCRMPLEGGGEGEINIGIYPSEFSTTPIITDPLVFTPGSLSSTLTCTSTGSVATSVTFIRDNITVGPLHYGESKTFDGVTYQLTQTVTNRAQSTYQNVLTINQLLADIVGSTFNCSVENTIGTSPASVPFTIMVTISAVGSETLGGIYNLSCNVTGLADVTVEYTWSGPGINGSGHDHQQLSLSPITLDMAGQYTCTATVSPLQLATRHKSVTIAIPAPAVQVSSNASSGDLYAGSELTLICTITIDDQLMNAGNMVMVTSAWMNDSIASNGQRITISEAKPSGSTNKYISTLSFNTLRMSDAGTYTCQANISHSSLFTTDGIGLNNTMITTKNPTVLLSLTSNTTRLPNVSPHNTFSLTCTATVPNGVISPGTFTWKRKRIDPGSGSVFQMVGNSVNTAIELDVPTSQSVLTVTEVAAGGYVYQCLVNLAELEVENSTDSTLITVSDFFLSINIIANGNAIAGESYTLTCTVSVTEGVPDTLMAHWSGPGVGMEDVTSGSVSNQTHENGSSFTFDLTFHSLRQSYNGEYNCTANLTTVSLTNTSITSLTAVAPPVTVIGIAHPMGLVIAGELFAIICMANGADGLEARFNFTFITEDNGAVIHHEENISDTQFNHSFTARASDAGMYICQVTITSSFLDEPITSMSTAVTLTVQIATPVVTVNHTSDASVTLRHGDSLNLTCTIVLDPAVDIDVTVNGTLSGQGIQGPSGTVEPIRSRVYEIKKTIASLKAARSAVYTCNATVSPDSGILNVKDSEENCSILNISVELFVNISVSYNPPPDVMLGPNEYRAASGPVIVNCTVTGGTSISYNWSSNCRSCEFQTAMTRMIRRSAVHSGDNGTHTCTATAAESIGSASINFTVKGAGIHVFNGVPTNSLSNNNLVSFNSMDMKFRLRLFCRSDSMMEDVGKLIGLDGRPVVTSNSIFFDISNPQPGELRVINFAANSTNLTASGQGVYTCCITLQSGETREINIGIYPSGFNTQPRITSLVFTPGLSVSTLTCTSTDSPATNVTWLRDGEPPMDGNTYQLSQTVTSRTQSTYENVLTINTSLLNIDIINHTYTCSVTNVIGTETKRLEITVSSLEVTIAQNGVPAAGQTSFSLECIVTLPHWNITSFPPTICFTGPFATDDTEERVMMVNESTYVHKLHFNALQTSHSGNYTCSANSTQLNFTDSVIQELTVTTPFVTVIGTVNPMNGTVVAGKLFSITCTVNGADGIQARFNFTLVTEDNGTVIHREENTRDTQFIHNFTARASDAGMYICRATVTSTFLDKPIISNTTVNLTVQIATPVLTMSRDPDASVTLRHGDPLNLTCTIELDPEVDINVTVTGALSGQGIQDPSGTVEPIRLREYQIRKTIASLRAARCAVYTCSVTVSPGPRVVNVLDSEKNCGILNITVELFVAIPVSYNPPSDAVLGPNEYRAASGPVIVNCTVTGGTGNISYQWTSDCRGCPFNNATSMSIEREAVHSGDTGNHTCIATTAEAEGNASITFTVKGAGIYVFRGTPTGSFTNHSLVSLINPMDMTFRLRFICRSDSMMEGVGKLIGIDGSFISSSMHFKISNPQPGELSVVNFVTNSTDLTAGEQGVYTCRIPLQSDEIMEISIGIYPSGFTTPPQITSLTFTDGSSTSFLTCTSTGSPATTVTWMRDGQPLTTDGGTYQLTQTVTNRTESSYENVLTIMEELSTVVEHHYSCIVSNIHGNASNHLNLTANPLNVAFMKEENPTAGRSFSLNCSLTLPQWAKRFEDPTIEFLNPANISDDGFIMKDGGEEMVNGGVEYIEALKFTPLQISHGKLYKCRASFRSQTAENETSLIVKIPSPTVTITPAGNDLIYSAGGNLTLICIIGLNGVLMDSATGIRVESTWTGPQGELSLASSQNGRITMSDVTKRDDGTYRSTVAISPLHMSDTGNYSCGANVSHMLEFILSSDPGTNQVMINVKAPVVTVTSIVKPVAGLVIAGKLFSITCMITGADNLQARFNFMLSAQRNNTIVNTTENIHLLHNFTARVSDAGNYTCRVNVTSSFLDEPITSSTTLTLTLQIPTPLLTMSRDPDASVTLRHGDSLNLTCTIELDPAVDIDVNVTGTLSGQGIQNPDYNNVKDIPSRVYQIKRHIASLEAARSAVYTCCATVSPGPGPGVVNVISSENNCRVLNITVDLAVTINVSYNPPPGVMLGPNEYRAASGPVKVTCIAMGGTPTVRYQWSSICRNCPFQDTNPKSNSSVILRAAVHSGDTGIHTCTATDKNGSTGNNSISFTITDAGIHVFNGVPKGSFLNNELVVSNDSDSNFHLRFFCRSDSMSNNAGELIGLHNSTLTNSHPFNISTPQPGELLVFVDSHTRLTPSHQGVYTCRISMKNGDITKINIGIYPNGFRGTPTVTSVIYRSEDATSNLTCNSISSPPTTVTWVLTDVMFTLRDGESVTVAGVEYELKQTLTNRRTSAYASTLTINATLAGNSTEYRCIVNNALGSDSKAAGEGGIFAISIIRSGTQTAGEMYTLTCSITVIEQVVDTLTAHWSGPGVHMDGVTATNVSILTPGNFSTFILDLTFTPLRQSHDGNYTCTATLAAFTNSAISEVHATAPDVRVIGIVNPMNGLIFAGKLFSITCMITGADNLEARFTFSLIAEDNGAVIYHEENASDKQLIHNFTARSSDAGIYTCRVTVTSSFLDDPITSISMALTLIVQIPLLKVNVTGGGVVEFGENLALDCAISGVDDLEGNITLQWRSPDETTMESTLPQLALSVSTVSFNHAGIYTCIATVSSPYLNEEISENGTLSVNIPVPSPDVAVVHDSRSIINAGSILVLPCTITLDRRVAQNEPLIVTNSWSGPHGELENETRITVMKEQGTSGQYLSNVTFNTIHVGDSGNYSCQANVSHPASQFIHQGMNTSVTTITVQAPNIALSLTPNTTRLPNFHPYNTFSLTCTATAPEGVVSPKTFIWWRWNTVMPGNITEVHDNETTQIINRALDEPVSTSVLTVTETTAGEWHYQCSVTLMELTNVANEAESHPIHVTRPASPEPPVDLLTNSVETDSATISWMVTSLAFTPETYVVHYGTSMDTLDSISDPMMESNFTAINYKISITLHGLTPNTMYFYLVNSTNTNGSYLSQVASFTTEGLAGDSVPLPVIVGAAAAAVVIIVFCIVVIAVWRLQKRSRGKVRLKRGSTAIDAMADVELITVVEDTEIDGHDAVLVSTLEDATCRKNIPIALLSDHVSDMRGERDKDFEAEYNSISKAALASHDVSAIPCNQECNRFVNIYPYDFSRVKLKEIEGVEGSDYINASFLDGYTRESEYIAAQGPVPESVGDFWRMIWENKLTTIVMLTKCEERGKRKCEKYWPNDVNQTLEPGHNLVVTLTALLPFVEYEIRMLSVKDPTHPDEPALEVTHFYYLSWPDHGVPTNSASLINFVRRVRKVQPHSTEVPLLVHCSAGVGRTGTFIAIDIEMQRIEAEGVVDVYGCTKKLRTRRVLMVQTLSQYIFIHEALTELIACGETDMIAASLRTTTNRLHQTVEEKKITGFQEQFEVLDQFSPDANIDHSSETNYPDNLQKNRYTSKVAGSLRRVYLKSTGQGASRSDYINANFVDGYRQRGAYIATQGPLASTVKDFWRMIWEHQSKCIVMLCSEQEEGEESCYRYWPNETGSTETQDEIEVTLLSEEKCGSCIIRKLQVLESTTMGDSDPESTTVTQFQLMCWPLNGQPSPPSSLLGVMDDVARVQMGTGNKPITVMCNDGVGRTGAFICLHAQLERLKAEGVVDIFQFIKSARLSRPGLVQNVEQYILCHEVLSDFVDSFETYANFKELV